MGADYRCFLSALIRGADLQLHRILRRFSGGHNEGVSTLEEFATSAFCPLRPLRLCVFAFQCLLVAAKPRLVSAISAFKCPLPQNPPNHFDRFDCLDSTHRSLLHYPCQDLPSKRHNVAAASEPTGGGAGGGPGKGRAAGPKPLTSDPQKPSNWFDRFDSPGSALSPLLVSIPTPLRLLRLLAAIPIPPISP